MQINFSKGDLLQGQPINPNWYKGKIVKEVVGTEGGRIDYTITLDFEDQQLKEDERTVTNTFYNAIDKGKGFLVPFMAAILKMPIKQITDGLEKGQTYGFEIGDNANVGKQIQFYVSNEPYQGRMLNKVTGFLPYDMEPPI